MSEGRPARENSPSRVGRAGTFDYKPAPSYTFLPSRLRLRLGLSRVDRLTSGWGSATGLTTLTGLTLGGGASAGLGGGTLQKSQRGNSPRPVTSYSHYSYS